MLVSVKKLWKCPDETDRARDKRAAKGLVQRVQSEGILKRNSAGYLTDCLWNCDRRRAVDWRAGRSQEWAC